MKFILSCATLFLLLPVMAQNIEMPSAKFITGDDMSYANTGYDDSKWKELRTNSNWESQGFTDYDGFAWYRFHVVIPTELKNNSYWKDSLKISLARIDDVDEVFLNGKKIGQSGSFPGDKDGYRTQWSKNRLYLLSAADPAVKWGAENIIAVRVYDGGGPGGIFNALPFVGMVDLIDGIEMKTKKMNFIKTSKRDDGLSAVTVTEISNRFNVVVDGTLNVTLHDAVEETEKQLQDLSINLNPGASKPLQMGIKMKEGLSLLYVFTEKNSKKKYSYSVILPYLLTPAPSSKPNITGARIFGIRPGSPFLFKIPATGARPIKYSVKGLPAGLVLDSTTGIITGNIPNEGMYKTEFIARNSFGTDSKPFTIDCGDRLSLTPPMGWNSWNCWGLSVSAEKLKASADAMISKGLIDHGWTYMNIDDGWEAEKRNADGTISPNKKFPNMKATGDYLHSKGLKFGIYSSPGNTTCGDFLGSYQHEKQDADSYNSWGIDYLKYDWCSYEDVYRQEKDTTLAAFKKPYEVMRKALEKQPRDIVYSLCQYGMKNVWEWGENVNGNCWRTTGDIVDTWQSLSSIGFNQTKQFPYARPGRWNDPDMLIVGQVGWGPNLHPTRLTPDEQYTHISLWSLLSAPLLIGCDLDKLDDFTLNLLTNDEVLAVNQDPLGKQAQQALKTAGFQIWMKQLEDGSKAIGIFNMTDKYDVIRFYWKDLGLAATQKVRDLWRQKNLGNFASMFSTKVSPHGVTLIKVK